MPSNLHEESGLRTIFALLLARLYFSNAVFLQKKNSFIFFTYTIVYYAYFALLNKLVYRFLKKQKQKIVDRNCRQFFNFPELF